MLIRSAPSSSLAPLRIGDHCAKREAEPADMHSAFIGEEVNATMKAGLTDLSLLAGHIKETFNKAVGALLRCCAAVPATVWYPLSACPPQMSSTREAAQWRKKSYNSTRRDLPCPRDTTITRVVGQQA